jgi:hypothetical protein
MMAEDDEIMEVLEYMEAHGILEWVGMDNTGDRMFVFNFIKMREIMPEFYQALIDEMDAELMKLYEVGYINVEYDESLTPRFTLTEAGEQYLMENQVVLPEGIFGEGESQT